MLRIDSVALNQRSLRAVLTPFSHVSSTANSSYVLE